MKPTHRAPAIRHYKALSFALLLASSVVPYSAHASSDGGCDANFSLDNRIYNECKANFPTLDTGNDTQTNLFLLLSDQGLVTLKPPKPNADGYNWYGEFPFTLEDLQENAISNYKNPSQTFLKDEEKHNEAEYCNSFNSGQDTLQKMLKLDQNLTARDREQLIQFREIIHNNCQSTTETASETVAKNSPDLPPLPTKWSANAQPYADYILATQMFYTGDKASFASSDSLYRALVDSKALSTQASTNAGLAWLMDTANYMLIRTAINRLYQSGMGEYNFEVGKIDPALARQSQQAIDNYLKNHPKGRYLASARGLQRRVYWLTGQQDKLIAEIEWQINHPNSALFNLDSRLLPEEIERKVFFTDYEHPLDINTLNDPILLTSFALSRLRPAVEGDTKPLTLAEIENLKPKFASRPELYQYLLATYYWVQKNDPKQALSYLPNDLPTNLLSNGAKGKLSYFDFSRYALKARALQQAGQTSQAVAVWQALQQLPKPTYQDKIVALALALEADRTNDYSQIFGKNSARQTNSTDLILQKQIIQYSADAKLLEQIINSRPVTDEIGAEARYALLTKSLLNRQYKEFLQYQNQYLPKNYQDYQGYDSKNEALKKLPNFQQFAWQGKKISPAITCQNLTITVTKLAQNPQDRLQMICLSEFINTTYIDSYLTKNWTAYPDKASPYRFPQLGDVPNRFGAKPLNRLDIYQAVFAGYQPDELSAYALHRAIGCFASSGNNQCSNGSEVTPDEIPLATRKGWYNQLKAKYGKTTWAKNQKYYW